MTPVKRTVSELAAKCQEFYCIKSTDFFHNVALLTLFERLSWGHLDSEGSNIFKSDFNACN